MSILSELAIKHSTDKWGHHWYTEHYNDAFQHLRGTKFNMLEIGVGGYEFPERGGGSLRMWKDYFPYANIFSIDIFDKTPHEEHRIKIFRGSQDDGAFLDEVLKKIGSLQLIIDDGSHMNNHVIASFEHLFPHLEKDGVYVVEDANTSYWPTYNGDGVDLNNKLTTMGYFKDLLNGLNCDTIPHFDTKPINLMIKSIQFYKNLIFIFKGDNI